MDLSPNALRRAYLEKRVTPLQVMDHVLARLGAEDQGGVWISTVDPDHARRAAKALTDQQDRIADLPLYGLPFSVKDNIDVAGQPTTAACPAFAYEAKASAFVVEQALAAGAIYIGKTNLDQFATGLVGVRSPYGIPRNPHNPDYIPGGSSSGAGVSVATSVVSFAFGTDTGGSGRVPASYNGIAGLKPAPGLLSRRGLVFACRSIDTPTIFAPNAKDTLAVFEAVNAFDAADPYAIQNISQAAITEPRICVPRPQDLRFFGNAEVEGLFTAATTAAASLFGAIPEIDFTQFTDLNDLMFFGPLLAERDASIGAFIDKNPEACDPTVRDLILNSRTHTAADAYRAQYRIADARIKTGPLWQNHDVLMVPTVGTVLTKAQVAADPLGPNFNNGYYTNFANPLGLTALATPFAITSAGVPWGVTFLTQQGSVQQLAAIAEQFTKTTKARDHS